MTSRIGRVAAHLSKMASKTPTDIHLYTAQTPNGIKASILLEELGLEYKVTHDDAARQSVWKFFVCTNRYRQVTTLKFSNNEQKASNRDSFPWLSLVGSRGSDF